MEPRNQLERAPQLGRFKVPIEAKRSIDSDLVLEQYLSPASPFLVGFCIDGLGGVRPRAAFSPSSDADMWDISLIFLEDRCISPALLYT